MCLFFVSFQFPSFVDIFLHKNEIKSEFQSIKKKKLEIVIALDIARFSNAVKRVADCELNRVHNEVYKMPKVICRNIYHFRFYL